MPQPRLIFWELTTGCNLRCIHCRATAQELSSPLDLPTPKALNLIDQISQRSLPILVLSGGEPLYRKDVFEIARYATDRGLPVALATNGTLVTPEVAEKIRRAGVRRVSISLDGAEAATHDTFRGIPGSFAAALRGMKNLEDVGVPVQINTTIARHNAHQLPQILDLAIRLGAVALHTFLLVPVGCGVEIAEQQMVPADEYERILNWFYDREKEGNLELKATCAPHYFRVRKQRQVEERRAAEKMRATNCREEVASGLLSETTEPSVPPDAGEVARSGGTLVPLGTLGVDLETGAAIHSPAPEPSVRPDRASHSASGKGHPGGHPGMSAVTKGCLAGSGVCFVSHKGEVFPCGYLPVKAGDVRTQTFWEIWEHSEVFQALRDTSNLEGKCGRCEFRNMCLGCRARAYASTGNYLDEEPFCVYSPKMAEKPATRKARERCNTPVDELIHIAPPG